VGGECRDGGRDRPDDRLVKILFVTQVPLDRPFGGARHVTAVARELVKLGHEITLVAPGREGAIERVHRVRPPAALAPGARMEAALAVLATRETMRAHYDGAHVRISASTSLVPLALAARRIPMLLELNGRILDELRQLGRPAPVIAIARQSLRAATRLACGVAAGEPRIAKHAEEELGARNVVVIESGADLDTATPGDRGEAREALGLDRDRRYIAYTGTLVLEQRFDLLLDALRRLDDATLLVAGGGPQAALLEDAAKRGRIVLLGAVPHDEAIQVIRAADVCVNMRDGDRGMKCFEYAAVGRRFVAFRSEGSDRLEALYPALDAVHLVGERTADGVARALADALDAERRLGPLPRDAIDRARGTIGWDHAARRIAEVLAACAGGG
jgi:glycosyltransferase involved in cell wall biosynthesis